MVALGYKVVAVSPDRPEKLKATVNKNQLSYELVSDSTMQVARALGIAFQVNDEGYKRLQGYGIDYFTSGKS